MTPADLEALERLVGAMTSGNLAVVLETWPSLLATIRTLTAERDAAYRRWHEAQDLIATLRDDARRAVLEAATAKSERDAAVARVAELTCAAKESLDLACPHNDDERTVVARLRAVLTKEPA